jgi:sugar phosphate permease
VRFASDTVAVLTGRRKVFYGWWLLASSVVAIAFASGASVWSYGLYVGPLEDEFGWSRGELSLGFSVALVAGGFAGPLAGRWIDKHGPRSAIVVGAIATGLSYLLVATLTELWQWYVYLGISSVCRQTMFFIPFQALLSRWFDRRRGLAISILGTGFSLGGFAVVPLIALVIGEFGWRGGFVFSGITIGVVFTLVGLLVIRNSPSEVGTVIDGMPREGEPERPAHREVPSLGLKAAMRSPLFWALTIGLMFYFSAGFGWVVHQVPFYESRGLSRGAATTVFSLTAAGGVVSRLLIGLIADRLDRFEWAVMVLALVQAAAMGTLLATTSDAGIAMFVVLWMIGSGGGPIMETILFTRAFGSANLGAFLGVGALTHVFAQLLTPVAAGAIFDSTGKYDLALIMFLSLYLSTFLTLVLATRMPVPERRERAMAGGDAAGGETPAPSAGAS